MGVYVYGPFSEYAKFVATKYRCEAVATGEATGSAICEPEAPDTKRQRIGSGDVSTGIGTSSEAAPQSATAGNICLKASDCDTANDYICATDKDIVADPSWGHFTCQYFPSAGSIIAAVATSVKIGSCRGRCLMGTDGTVEVPASDKASDYIMPVVPAPNTLPSSTEASLTCPCNCTYVSRACCMSSDGIVVEDSTEALPATHCQGAINTKFRRSKKLW